MDQAEQLRNIIKQRSRREHLARVITVTSGKGGVGKSNVSVNLAIQFSRLRKRVVILDADFGLANIEVMLGIRPQYSLADLMFRGKSLSDVISPGPENISFISGGSGIQELVNLNTDQTRSLTRVLYELDSVADVIIVDTGAGISDSVINLVLASPEVLLVATPEPTSITDAYALLKTLCRHPEFYENAPEIKVVANRAYGYYQGRELFDKLDAVVQKFLNLKMEYLGYLPYDEKLLKAIMQQRPVSMAYPNAAFSRAILGIATMLENGGESAGERRGRGLSGLLAKMLRHGK